MLRSPDATQTPSDWISPIRRKQRMMQVGRVGDGWIRLCSCPGILLGDGHLLASSWRTLCDVPPIAIMSEIRKR